MEQWKRSRDFTNAVNGVAIIIVATEISKKAAW